MTLDIISIFLAVYALVVTALLVVAMLKKDSLIQDMDEALRRADDLNIELSEQLAQAKKNDTPRDPVTGQFMKVPR